MRDRLIREYSSAKITTPRHCAVRFILVYLVTGASIAWIGLSHIFQSEALELTYTALTRTRATMRERLTKGYSSARTSRTHTLRWSSRAYSSTLSSSRTSACTPPLAKSSVVVCPAVRQAV